LAPSIDEATAEGRTGNDDDGAFDALEFASRLIRCPSVTPAEAGALDLLGGALEGMGFTVRRLEFHETGTAPVANLSARLGDGAPNLCFAGHTDVVPVGDATGWRSEPFSGEVRDGQLWGRGAADMKGAIAAFVAATHRFLGRRGPDFGGSISFLITGGGEGPPVNGTKKVLRWREENG